MRSDDEGVIGEDRWGGASGGARVASLDRGEMALAAPGGMRGRIASSVQGGCWGRVSGDRRDGNGVAKVGDASRRNELVVTRPVELLPKHLRLSLGERLQVRAADRNRSRQ